MSASLTSESEYAFICDCDESMRTACEGEIFYAKHNDKRYCVLHFPGRKSTLWNALRRKLDRNDFNFHGAWFPGPSSFEYVKFTTDASFEGAHFDGEVDFTGASFEGNVNFSGATFDGGAYFAEVTFKSANFSGASFHSITRFNFATFATPASFQYCQFQDVSSFIKATFDEEVSFHGACFSSKDFLHLHIAFDCVDFRGTRFRGRVEFGVARFNSVARFNEVIFEGVVDLSNGIYGGC
jgi:uncharacterized protein YjbI with pentapeptide repeats